MANIFKQPCDEGVIRSKSVGTPCARAAKPWILAAMILGSSMAFIGGTVVNVALPALQANLDATRSDGFAVGITARFSFSPFRALPYLCSRHF